MSTRAKVQIIGENAIYEIYRIQDGDVGTVMPELVQALDDLPQPAELVAKLLRNPAYTSQYVENIDTTYQVVYAGDRIELCTWIAQ